MSTVPFVEWLPATACEPVSPLNLEHLQARCQHVHDTVVRILHEHRFKARAVSRFPLLENIESRSAQEIAAWWLDFYAWHSDLSRTEMAKLHAAPVET